MSSEIDIIIAAGGKGSRMGELTTNQQKCMLMVDEKPILSHLLETIQNAFGSGRIIIATGFKGEIVKNYFGFRFRKLNIDYVHNNEHLEYRKRLLLAASLLRPQVSFMAMAGDILCLPTHLINLAEKLKNEPDLTGVISGATDHVPAPSHGVIDHKSGIVEKIQIPPPESWSFDSLRDMSISIYRPDFLQKLLSAPDTVLAVSPLINESIKERGLFGVQRYAEKWFHFFKPTDLQQSIEYNQTVGASS